MSHTRKLASHYLELADTPASRESYAGEDVRYSVEFEALETELGKATSLHGSGPIDWQKILEDSERLLREQSKDLRVAAWLTWALQQRESFSGLLAGLGMLLRLCEQHWDDLHPRKPRTRAAALEWLATRLEPLFADDVAVKEQLPLFRQ
jgi:type VI secretion system protein VasJ